MILFTANAEGAESASIHTDRLGTRICMDLAGVSTAFYPDATLFFGEPDCPATQNNQPDSAE